MNVDEHHHRQRYTSNALWKFGLSETVMVFQPRRQQNLAIWAKIASRPTFFSMARFMIHWCAPDPTNEEYTKAIVNYIKGGKSMDEFAGFKVLARQIHPHTGGGVLLVEADDMAAVQKHTYPWTKGLGVTATITPGLSDEEYVELEESMTS